MAQALNASKGFVKEPSLLGHVVIGFFDGQYLIKLCKRCDVEPIITKNHYSGTLPKNSAEHYLVYYNGEVHGAISLGYGIRPKMKKGWGIPENEQMFEFDRMWLSDAPPKNSESKIIGMLVKTLRARHPMLRWLISYADGTVGNTGTIYKASNFKEMPPIRADFYILADGTRVHPVTMYHRHKSRAWHTLQKLYPGIKKADGLQYRFIKRV